MALDNAKATQIGAYHFSAESNIYEIQRGNNFEFVIDRSLNGLSAYGSETKTFARAQEYIRLSCSATSVPHFSQNPIEVRRGNTAVKYAGVITWPSGTLECYDFIGAEVKDILMGWQAKSGNPLTQQVGLQAEYKYPANLIEYTPDYKKIVRTWKLDGCWISNIEEDQYSADANGARKVRCTIEYDRAYVDTYEESTNYNWSEVRR